MSTFDNKKKIGFIAECAERACLLEAVAKKPGNVNPDYGFDDTSYDDFVAGAKAMRPVITESATRGFRAARSVISLRNLGIGSLIKKAVVDVRNSHGGGNTHLGTIMLLIPISCGAGMCVEQEGVFSNLRENINLLLAGTTVEDSISLFEAINIASPGGLGASELDVKNENSRDEIVKCGITLLDVMKMSSPRDMIARELTGGMPVIFGFGAPMLNKLAGKMEIEDAIVQTYLICLSRYPDTLIARKIGMKKSEMASAWAKEAVELGGVLTEGGRAAIKRLDERLRYDGNKFNPGTTADLVAASLMVALLQNWNNV